MKTIMDKWFARTRLILLAGLVSVLAVGARAQQDDLQRHLGLLAPVVDVGTSGDWQTSVTSDWFVMTNVLDPTAIRYYWTTADDLPDNYEITMRAAVRTGTGSPAHGGLIFNFREGPRYFGVTIGSDNSATLFVRGEQGVESFPAENVMARGDGSDQLRIAVMGRAARFELNGEKLFELTGENGFRPTFGVFAVGQGTFGFTDLKVAAMNALPSGPPDLPSANPGGPPTLPSSNPGGPPPLPGSNPAGPPPIPSNNPGGPPPIPGNTPGGPPPLPGNTPGGPPPLPGANPGGPPPIPGQSSQQNTVREQVYLASALGIFTHELGHAIIGETRLPSTGPEEDVADSFAAHALASAFEEAPLQNKPYIQGMVEYSALMWYHMAKLSELNNVSHDWQDEHSPDIKRFRNWFCIVYGSNPQSFDAVAQKVGLTDRTRQRCQWDFDRVQVAWEELLATRGRNLGPDLPGAHPADTPGGRVIVTFHPSATAEGQYIETLLNQTGIVKGFADLIGQYFVLPRDLKVDFGDCKEVNAWYDPNQGSVTMCYSAIEWFASVVVRGEGLQF